MSNSKMRIQVLMPTYNGERFLAEQLDSILAQQGHFELRITVRDDGSTDGTRAILAHYSQAHGVHVVFGERVGVNAAVMALVNGAPDDADLYAFSDQDDVWYPFRLQEAVTAIQARPSGRPLLWTCMEELTDEDLHVLCAMPRPKLLGDMYNAIIQNKTPGHTQVFNQALRVLLKGYPPQQIFVYDWVLYLLACTFGEVLYCSRSCGKYRQHSANAIGYSANWLAHLLRRLQRLRRGDLRGIAAQQGFYLARYHNSLPEASRHALEGFVHSRGCLLARIRFAFTTRTKRDTWFESLQFRILYILGVF